MDCPSCNSSRVYKSRARTNPERIMHALLPIHYYRCHSCNWRGMRFRRRIMNITIIVLLGVVFGFLLFELASPILRVMLQLVLS